MQPALHIVTLARIGERGHATVGHIEPVQLGRLVAAAAAREDEIAAVVRFVARVVDRVGEIGELLGRGQRRGDPEKLRRIGAGLAVRDQHLAPGRMPVDEAVATEVGIAFDLANHAARDRWNALQHEVRIRLHDRSVGRRRPGSARLRAAPEQGRRERETGEPPARASMRHLESPNERGAAAPRKSIEPRDQAVC